MDDQSSMVLLRVEEFVTDPEQIHCILLLDRDARANTCMDKQKIAAREMIAQTLQE